MARQPEPQRVAQLDANGAEIPDPRPIAIPAGFQVPETTEQMIRRITATALSQQAEAQGDETFEESEDFDVDDETFEPHSPFEEVFDPVLGRAITPDEFRKNRDVYKARYEAAEEAADEAAYQAFVQSEALRARFKREFEGGGEGGNPPPAPQPPPTEGK